MPGSWWSSVSDALRGLRAAALVAAVLSLAAPAAASTVLSRTVVVAFAADGSFTERVAMRIRLDEAGDLADWSPWVVALDDNRTLVAMAAAAWRPDGSVVVVGEEHATTVAGLEAGGVLHSSAGYRMLEIPPLPAGATLQVSSEVREEPWLASTAIPLTVGDAPVEELRVRVSGAGGSLRWRIDPAPAAGDASPFTVEELADGIRVSADGLDPTAGSSRPVLRLAWDAGGTWGDVGRWYQALVAEVPRRAPAVAARARELVADEADARARVALLLDHVRESVRYVAVEVGVGGYRPSPPAEVLERRWGDCKDKSFLLLDLLAEAGVTAYPALVRLDEERGVVGDFPAADQFNHLIVAVPAAAVEPLPGDAASAGYLFLDPTQDSGGLAWLHPALQGQSALVVRGAESELVPVPVFAARELRDLAVRLEVDETGDAAGEAVLRLTGRDAWLLGGSTGSATPDELGVIARRVLEGLLAGAAVGPPRWRQGDEEGVPVVELSAPVRFDRLVQGRSTRSLTLPGTAAFPRPDEPPAASAQAVRPALRTGRWEVSLPPGWCPPEIRDEEVANDAGSFRQLVEPIEDGGFRLERSAELPHRWIGPELAGDLRELALAERRAERRRLRLSCRGGEAAAGVE